MLRRGCCILAVMALTACSGQPTEPATPGNGTTGKPPSGAMSTAPIDRSVKGAINVVRRYYAAINAGDYDTAYAQWGESGPPGQTYDDFVSGFAQTARVTVDVTGTVRPEGAAGSVYATVPVSIHAQRTDGRTQQFDGHYVVRRVNDVPGASQAQLHWHLDGADLHEVR